MSSKSSATHLSLGPSAGPRTLALPNGLAVSVERGHLHFSTLVPEKKVADFLYRVAIPGEIAINELDCRLRFLLVEGGDAVSSYDPGQRLRADLTGSELIIRNWRAGDRFGPGIANLLRKLRNCSSLRGFPPGNGHSGRWWNIEVRFCGDEGFLFRTGFAPEITMQR